MQPQRSKEPLNIRICDTPGISETNISSNDLVYMLDGHLSDRLVFNFYIKVENDSIKFTNEFV